MQDARKEHITEVFAEMKKSNKPRLRRFYLWANVVEHGAAHIGCFLLCNVLINSATFLAACLYGIIVNALIIAAAISAAGVFVALSCIIIPVAFIVWLPLSAFNVFDFKSFVGELDRIRLEYTAKAVRMVMDRLYAPLFCVGEKYSPLFKRLFCKRHIFFCDVLPENKDAHDTLLDRARHIGATVMRRDITELRMKWWCRKRIIYLISDNDSENTEHAAALHNCCTNPPAQNIVLNCDNTEIYVFASNSESEYIVDDLNNKLVKIKKEEICERAKTKRGGKRYGKRDFDIMHIRRVNEYANFAMNFFWEQYDKFLGEDKELNVAVIGCGRYGVELVKTLCCIGQLPGRTLKIDIYDKDIETVCANLPSKDKQQRLQIAVPRPEYSGRPVLQHSYLPVRCGSG